MKTPGTTPEALAKKLQGEFQADLKPVLSLHHKGRRRTFPGRKNSDLHPLKRKRVSYATRGHKPN